MPVSKIAFVRATVLAMLVGLAALMAIVTTVLWLVSSTRTISDTLNAARQQRSALVDLRGMLQDMETGQRGYVLTGDDDYLDPFEEARGKVDGQFERLRSAFANSQATKETIDQLWSVSRAKIAEMQETIGLVKASHRDDAIAVVRNNRGRELMDQARDIFDRLVPQAEGVISTSVQRQQRIISQLRGVTLLGAVVILLVVSGCAWMVIVYTRQLTEAQREVQTLNFGLEERVRERTVDLGRANEEIQRFAYIVTHDLRAPLVNVMGFTTELETSLAAVKTYMEQSEAAADNQVAQDARTAALEDAPEAIGFIRSSTRKMDGLINAILKLSREGRRTLKPERIELDALMHVAVANVQHQVTEVGGKVLIDGTTPAVVSDRLALEQIFGNLFDNAVKYRSPHRPLEIHVRMLQERGQWIIVEVADNGRGIAPQDHERVFDLFRRSGAQDQTGEGIGLAHVRTMVRNLGGDITLRSELERGTTLRVSLPRYLRETTGVAT